jgi:hypothetical protein
MKRTCQRLDVTLEKLGRGLVRGPHRIFYFCAVRATPCDRAFLNVLAEGRICGFTMPCRLLDVDCLNVFLRTLKFTPGISSSNTFPSLLAGPFRSLTMHWVPPCRPQIRKREALFSLLPFLVLAFDRTNCPVLLSFVIMSPFFGPVLKKMLAIADQFPLEPDVLFFRCSAGREYNPEYNPVSGRSLPNHLHDFAGLRHSESRKNCFRPIHWYESPKKKD